MQSAIYRIGRTINSLELVIVALLLTIVANIFFSHTVFYQTLPDNMITWEKSLAAYVISVSYEMTLLIVVCNTELLPNKRIPIALSICSGIVILFFIQAFEANLTVQEYIKRIFIGGIVTSINIVFTSLFYKKWCESNHQKSQSTLISELTTNLSGKESELKLAQTKINQLDSRLLEASGYIIELEAFKKAEISKLICPHCGVRQASLYHLASHKGVCGRNPKFEAKMLVNHDEQ